MALSSKNTMTRDAMMFLPAKVVEGLLVIACSSLYTHIFVEGAVTGFNLTNTTVQLIYLILAGWMANSATRYVGEEYRADSGRGLFSTVSTIYLGLCVIVAAGCGITAVVTGNTLYWGGALMFCSYTAFQVLNAALIQLGRVKASIFWSLTSATLKLAVAFALVGGKSNYPSAFPAIFANTIADGVASVGAVFALGLPTIVRLRYFSKPLLNRFLKYGVPLMGVSISVALLNQIDKYLVVGFYGDVLYAAARPGRSPVPADCRSGGRRPDGGFAPDVALSVRQRLRSGRTGHCLHRACDAVHGSDRVRKQGLRA